MEVWFEDLVCIAPFSKRRILNDVSGRFLPGQLTGILGPSGSGKTTLLNAISGYRRRGVSGQMVVSRSCYIGQEDVLAPLLSAGELMAFAARLKLPSHTEKQRAVIIDQLLGSLSLEECCDTMTENLSGGQRRRLSIALELINNPPVIFLDEPTSGLDTVAAGQMIRLLNQLSRGGRTVVCTIHQPSASLLDLFDRIYIVAGGRCIYQGGTSAHLLLFLAMNGFVCPRHHNIADFAIELTEDENHVDVLCKASRNGKLVWFSKEVDQTKNVEGQLTTDCEPGTHFGCLTYDVKLSSSDEVEEHKHRASFWLQFSAVFYRLLLQAVRNRTGLYIQFYHHLGCGLAMGLMFHNKGRDGAEFFNQMKFCMAVILFHTYTQLMVPILYYPFEVKLLKREHFNQWYRLFPYYSAFTLSKIPYILFLNTLYMSLMYGLAGLPWQLDRFGLFCLIGVMTSLVAEALGLTIGAIFSVTNGTAVGPLSLAPFFGLAMYGFDFARSIPPLMEPLVRTSFMRAAVVAIVLVVYGLDRQVLECGLDLDTCHFRDPKVVLHYLDLDRMSLARPIFDLFLSLFFFRLTFYLALKWRLRR